MTRFLIFVEQKGDEPRKASLEILSKAYGLAVSGDASVEAVAVGPVSENVKEKVLPYVSRFVQIAGPGLDSYTAEGVAAALGIYAQESKPDVILAGATNLGRDFFPRLAVLLGSGIASDATEMDIRDGAIHFVRPMYGGKVLSEVSFTATPALATIRPNAYPVTQPGEARGEFVTKEVDVSGTIKTKVIRVERQDRKRADLTEAETIVAGGRGMKAQENFQLLEDLAEVIGATVGASRSVVDAKWRDQEDQVGKSGKTVSPKLYIAAGISGAIHHIMGMDTSKVIVAINRDPEAPIFNVATYGIVGDLFEVVPALTAEFRKRLAR